MSNDPERDRLKMDISTKWILAVNTPINIDDVLKERLEATKQADKALSAYDAKAKEAVR
jgi:hypothetical protein